MLHSEPRQTLREARALYFLANHFGDGGYDDAWVDFKLGPLPVPFPNTRARVRAVRYHDLHHVLTGYATDTLGEFEISAWEIAAGCKGYVAAWQLNLGGMLFGFLVAPRRVGRAFMRGRHSRTLYGRPFEALLDQELGDLRAELGVERPTPAPGPLDAALLTLALLAGAVTSAVLLPLVLLCLPVGLLTLSYRRRKAQGEPLAERAPAP